VALPAGCKDILPGKRGSRIQYALDGMSSMAIIAFCHCGITEPSYFSVIGLPVFLYLLAVAIAACHNEIHHPFRIFRVRDKMFLMAIKTDGGPCILIFEKFSPMDACAVFLKLSEVAPGTESGDVLFPG
jgi:hypothetical protein